MIAMLKSQRNVTPDIAVDVRADFARREVVLPGGETWRPTPTAGIEHYVLERIDAGGARETALVRYAAGARGPGGAEEFLVLAGSLHDDTRAYREGAYVRNPVGLARAAWAGSGGAVLFVKRHQFKVDDPRPVVIDTRTARWHRGLVPGLSVLPLHQHGAEHVALVRWAPSTLFKPHQHWGGEEILVLEGVFEDEHGAYPKGSWLRSPHLSEHHPFTRVDGALIYVKTGHLGAR